MTINGAGVGGQGAILSVDGSNVLTGLLTPSSASSIDVSNGDLTIIGQITDGAGSFPLSKLGTGTLSLTNANPFDSGTDVTGGVLSISNGDALGSGLVTDQDGAALDLSGGITVFNDLAISGLGVGNNGAIRNVSGENVLSGTVMVQLDGTQIQVDADSLDVSGNLADGGNLYSTIKSGLGLLQISGNATSTGPIVDSSGDVRVTGSYLGAIQFTGGVVSGTGAIGSIDQLDGQVGKVDPGTGSGTTGILSSALGYGLASGTTTHIDNGGLAAGAGYDQIVNSPSGSVDLTDSILEVALDGGYVPGVGDTFTIIDNQSTNPVVGNFAGLGEGAIFSVGNVPFQITYHGGPDNNDVMLEVAVKSTWTGLGGNNLWSTGANWASGIAPAAGDQLVFPDSAAQASSVNDLAAGTEFDSVLIAGAGYTITGNAIQIDNGLSATYVSGASTFSLDTTLPGAQSFVVAGGATLKLAGVLNGSSGLTKTGAGTLELDQPNGLTGNLDLNPGILLVTQTEALGSADGAELLLDSALDITINAASGPIQGSGVNGAGAVVSDRRWAQPDRLPDHPGRQRHHRHIGQIAHHQLFDR